MGYKIIKLLIVFILCSNLAFALNQSYYFTQSGAGTQDGKSWANAWSMTNFNDTNNWDTIDNVDKIDHGDIIYGSGEITSQLVPKGSGTDINKIYFNLKDAVLNPDNVGRALSVDTKSNLVFLGIEVTGTCTESQLMRVRKGKNITFDGLYIHDTAKIGLQFYADGGVDSEHLLVKNLRCEDTTAMCLQASMWGGTGGGEEGTIHDITIEDFHVSDVSSLIQFYGTQANIYPNGDESVNKSPYNIIIRNGTIENTNASAISTVCGCRDYDKKALISHVVLKNIGSPTQANINALQLNNCDGAIVEYSEVENIQTSATDGVALIFDWAFTNNNFITEKAISRHNYFHGNRAQDNGRGLYFYKAKDCLSYMDRIVDNSVGIAEANSQSTGNKVYDVELWGNDIGTKITNSAPVIDIQRTKFIKNLNYGIYISSDSVNPTTDFNMFIKNGGDGGQHIYKQGTGLLNLGTNDFTLD